MTTLLKDILFSLARVCTLSISSLGSRRDLFSYSKLSFFNSNIKILPFTLDCNKKGVVIICYKIIIKNIRKSIIYLKKMSIH